MHPVAFGKMRRRGETTSQRHVDHRHIRLQQQVARFFQPQFHIISLGRTVQVTPEDAKKIILAQDVGKVTATLRHPDDLVPMNSKETRVSDLFVKKPIKRYKKAKIKKGIEFIIGGV